MSKKILIDDLKIGMKFTAPLYTDDNNVVLESNVTIKEPIYNRFVRWGIKELYTNGEMVEGDENEVASIENGYFSTNNYIQLYNKVLSSYEDFLDNVMKNENYNKGLLEEIIKDILDLIVKFKNDIISYMAIENDKYDYQITHAVNTTILALIGGLQLKLDDKKIKLLGISCLLHDVGMMKISKDILNKKEKLTTEEFNTIKAHPVTVYKELSTAGLFNQDVLDAILQHHEQFDGNGYPRKLKGDKINIYAKIIAIADTFEAQITRRVYRKAKTGYTPAL